LQNAKAIEGIPPMTAHMPAEFDESRFQRLLALVGPVVAVDFLRQLLQDLSDCAEGIARAGASGDWARLREVSHILISLAGSTGAAALYDMAKALNAAAHAQDQAALDRLSPVLGADLQALIALVRRTRIEPG
jgi:HPt (histidine-containing phosphotransfer) domain-containing protein